MVPIPRSGSAGRRDRGGHSGRTARRFHSAVGQKLLDSEADVAGYLAQQDRRDVPAGVIWHRRAAAVRMPILFVEAPLAHFFKAQGLQNARDFTRFEGR